MPRAIIHVDMDAFYASVEQRDNPRLAGRPVIVGGHPTRGVVLAASYEVRPFGVKSAMPMARALKLAPHAIVVPPRPAAYATASEQVFSIFESATPLVEALSLDEAFLDVTQSVGLWGPPAQIAQKLRERISRELRLTASAGIGAVKFVAKIASDVAKPNGQKEVPAAETTAFLAPLPVSRLWGVGPKTEKLLQSYGLFTIGLVAQKPAPWLEERLGALGQHLWELARGIDLREVVPDRDAKSIGSEDTFEEDLADPELLRLQLHAQALRVAQRLRQAGLQARTIQLKIKYGDFEVITRRQTIPEPTNDGQTIYRTAMALLDRAPLNRGIRLTGVSAQNLMQRATQLALFEPKAKKSQRLNAALDQIAEKFGPDAIRTADLAEESGLEALAEEVSIRRR